MTRLGHGWCILAHMNASAGRPVTHFSVAGVPVHVNPWFFVIPASGALSGRPGAGLVWIVVVVLSVLWHELGHAFAMKHFGYEPRIELVAMGGLTIWPERARPSAGAAFLVSLAGPAAGLALGGLIWLATRSSEPWPPLVQVAVTQALWVNVGWSLVNLLPVIPLDGSALLDHGSRHLGGAAEPRWVGAVSLVAGVVGAVVAIRFRMTWAAILGVLGAGAGWERLQGTREALGRRPNPWEGEPVKRRAAQAAARAAAERGDRRLVLDELLPHVRSNRLEPADLALVAGALVAGGEAARLRALCLERLEAAPRAGATNHLVSVATEELADAGQDAEAFEVHRAAFERIGAPSHAYEAARCLVRLKRPDEAVAWLGRSLDAGLDGGAAFLADPVLEPIREREDFTALLVRVAQGRGVH